MAELIFIEGVSGVGKSTLTHTLTSRLKAENYSVKCYAEFDADNPIDFYCTAYLTKSEYNELCSKYVADAQQIRLHTISAGDAELVRYYDHDTPLFDGELLRELEKAEFCYHPSHLVPLDGYTKAYTEVWRAFAATCGGCDYMIFDGSLLHHPINDMMRNYDINREQALEHITSLISALGSVKRRIYYLMTQDICAQLRKAHSDRGENPPSADENAFWQRRFQNDMYVLNNLNENYEIFDVSQTAGGTRNVGFWTSLPEKTDEFVKIGRFSP